MRYKLIELNPQDTYYSLYYALIGKIFKKFIRPDGIYYVIDNRVFPITHQVFPDNHEFNFLNGYKMKCIGNIELLKKLKEL